MVDKLLAGGDVVVSKLELVNFNGDYIDLRHVFVEMQIYEDLFNGALSGTIEILDTLDLVNNFPIIGEEKLLVTFKTSGFPEEYEVSHVFNTYKVSDQLVVNPHKTSYRIHFTTPESFMDMNLKLSKAYSGNPTNIVETLLTKELETGKSYDLEECSNNIKFVSPFWSPLKCINYVTKQAASLDRFKTGGFVFFETNLSYRMASLNTLYSAPAIADYNYNNDPARNTTKDSSERDIVAEMSKIYDIRVDDRFNQLDRMLNGSLSHKMWDHNLLFKRIDKRYYHYDNDFNNTKHLDGYPVVSKNYFYSNDTLMSSNTSIPYVFDEMKFDNLGKNLTSRIPLLNQLNMTSLEITVHGRTDIEVGDVVNINVGGTEVITKDNKSGTDDYFNGRYLVTSIMHRVTLKKHSMVMRCSKESVNKTYKTWGNNK